MLCFCNTTTFLTSKTLSVNMAKIPSNANKVFNGILYDVYHYDQKMFDGTTQTFEMLKRKPSVQVIPIKDGKIIMAHEEQPGTKEFTTFVGGCSESDEEPLVAAKRELLEETGLTSDDWELIFTLEIPGRIDWDIHFYAARGCTQIQEVAANNGEKITLKELSFDEFIEFTKRDDFRNKVFKSHMAKFDYDQEKINHLKAKLSLISDE
jgi:ADP-ribose pyrophosphatase